MLVWEGEEKKRRMKDERIKSLGKRGKKKEIREIFFFLNIKRDKRNETWEFRIENQKERNERYESMGERESREKKTNKRGKERWVIEYERGRELI